MMSKAEKFGFIKLGYLNRETFKEDTSHSLVKQRQFFSSPSTKNMHIPKKPCLCNFSLHYKVNCIFKNCCSITPLNIRSYSLKIIYINKCVSQ